MNRCQGMCRGLATLIGGGRSVTSPNVSSKATVADMLAAATKLDSIADEMERTGQEVGAAAAAAVGVNIGLQTATESHAMCGTLGDSVSGNVKKIREQASQLRATAAEYEEKELQSQNQMSGN